ncbi:MAG: DPP IV N-terminal domain-containing protein, partial [Gammaproteobacteria bacterium]|nr:DPP IV N-terminal domain-containing protein [Gammaproteobacteria bacterium]
MSCRFGMVSFLLASLAMGVPGAVNGAPPPSYTIAQIFAEPGLTGYHPEDLEWSPDGRYLSYLLRHPGDAQADLYAVDLGNGKTSMLLSAQQLAGAAAPASAIKNLRERERVTRYHVYSYHWSPKSDAIYFLSNDQVYIYNLSTHRIAQITSAPGAKRDPQLSPDERWISYVSNGDLQYAAVGGGPVRSVAPHVAGVLNGELDWVYTEELDLRSAYRWSPDSRYLAFLQFDQRPVQGFPLIDYLHQHPAVYLEKYPTAGSANPIVRLGVFD